VFVNIDDDEIILDVVENVEDEVKVVLVRVA